jgi:hypothetical protein
LLGNKVSLSWLSPSIVSFIHYNNMICLGYSEPAERMNGEDVLFSAILSNLKTFTRVTITFSVPGDAETRMWRPQQEFSPLLDQLSVAFGTLRSASYVRSFHLSVSVTFCSGPESVKVLFGVHLCGRRSWGNVRDIQCDLPTHNAWCTFFMGSQSSLEQYM